MLKVLIIAKITFCEKFEQIYLTVYYKTNMMLIVEFPSEPECDKYLNKLQKLVEFFSSRALELKP